MEVAGNAVGIDLGKRTYEMCIISRNGKIARTGGKTDFSGIEGLCRKLKKDDVVAVEACSLAFRIERSIRSKVGCRCSAGILLRLQSVFPSDTLLCSAFRLCSCLQAFQEVRFFPLG